ncbi:MAG: hypothetical protein PQJ44_01780, partial [Sphaerochaetaceae bacterium]|nr:hypothetical protein [Sphaerochaetaceae bacterium]
NKKLGIIVAIIVILIAGNYYKNSYIESELDKALKENIEKDMELSKKLSYEEINCNGLLKVDCSFNNVKLLIDKNNGETYLSAENIKVGDIAQFEKLKSLDINDKMQMQSLLIDILKDGMTYDISIENLNIDSSGDFKNLENDFKNSLNSTFNNDMEVINLIVKNLEDLKEDGIDYNLVVSFDGSTFKLEDSIKTAIYSQALSTNISYAPADINNIYDAEKTFNNAIFNNINFAIDTDNDLVQTALYIMLKNTYYTSNRYGQRNINFNLANNLGIDTTVPKLTFNEFKTVLKSDKVSQNLKAVVAQMKSNSSRLDKSGYLNKIVDALLDKSIKLTQGVDKNLEVDISSKLSINALQEEYRSIIFYGKTSKPFDELIQIEIN